MVTPRDHHAIANLDSESIMSLLIRRFVFIAAIPGLVSPALAQQSSGAEGDAGRKPLNLSLPREASLPPPTFLREDPALRDNLRSPAATNQPEDAARRGRRGLDRDDGFAPYGTGYEARQRGGGRTGFGGNDGFGGGRGAGRGR
jgi:hypothetical protein